MKKLIASAAIAAALIFSVALVGCGGGDEEYGYQT